MGVYPRYGNAGSTFRGFLVSAYDKTTGAPVGEMSQTAQTNAASWPQNPPLMRTCGDTSLTHTSRLPKEEVYFEWRAPADYDKDVVELRYGHETNFKQWLTSKWSWSSNVICLTRSTMWHINVGRKNKLKFM